MPPRRNLGYLIRLLSLALSLPLAAQTQQPVAGAQADTLPLADVHFHLMWFMTPLELKERMEKHNVRWVVSAGAIEGMTGVESFARDLEARKLLGNQFLPSVGWMSIRRADVEVGVNRLYTDETSPQRDALLKLLDEQLSSGQQAVFSELHPNALTSTTIRQLLRRLPTDAPLFRELYKLSIKHKVPLPMHMQWHPESVEQLARLLESDREGVVLLSHCGKDSQAEQIRIFFERHPNVLCDLGFRSPPQSAMESGQDPARTIYWGAGLFSKAGIKPEWARLIEDYPDRFMVAVDDVHRWSTYDEVIKVMRTGLLAQLRPETAEKVAYRNAVRVFRLKDPEAAQAQAVAPASN
jgi:hypothetical protein